MFGGGIKGERGIVWGEIKTMGNYKSGIMMGRELSDLEYKNIQEIVQVAKMSGGGLYGALRGHVSNEGSIQSK